MCTKLPLKWGHLSNQDTVDSPGYIEMCTKLPLKWGHPFNQDTFCCPKGVHNREVPLISVPTMGLRLPQEDLRIGGRFTWVGTSTDNCWRKSLGMGVAHVIDIIHFIIYISTCIQVYTCRCLFGVHYIECTTLYPTVCRQPSDPYTRECCTS